MTDSAAAIIQTPAVGDLAPDIRAQRAMIAAANQFRPAGLGWSFSCGWSRVLNRFATLGDLFDAHALRLFILTDLTTTEPR